MSTAPIIQYWHSPDPPARIARLTKSFADLNPGRRHLVFDASAAARFISEHLGERERAAFAACGPPAMQADYFRCCALLHHGGIYADAGFACARALDPLLEGPREGELFRSFVSEYILMNGLLAFRAPRHPFLRLALEVATGLIEMRWPGKVNEVTGPLVLTSIWRLHQAGSADAFLDEIEERAPAERREHLIRYARIVCELIGEAERASEACAGVRVSAAETCREWVRRPEGELEHRKPGRHWPDIGPGVYAPGSASPGRR